MKTKRKPMSDETKRKLSLAKTGVKRKPFSDETRIKMSLAHKGETFSEEHRKNLSKCHKGDRCYNYGEHLSVETKNKISESNTGKIRTLEMRKNYSKSKKGIKLTKEHRRKLSKILTGKIISEETKNKISEATTGEKNPNWRDGKSFEPYTINFSLKFKRAIRKRDNQICMLCGIHREKLTRALCVHHINYDKSLSISQNCISLCLDCHLKTNYHREKWTKFCQEILSEKYGYQYNNQEIVLEVKNQNES